MQRGFASWVNPFQSADVDRDEQRKAASGAFHDLVTYYHSNSVWLDRRTCERIEFVIPIRNRNSNDATNRQDDTN